MKKLIVSVMLLISIVGVVSAEDCDALCTEKLSRSGTFAAYGTCMKKCEACADRCDREFDTCSQRAKDQFPCIRARRDCEQKCSRL